MHLTIPDKLSGREHTILLGRKESDFSGLLHNPDQRDYLKNRMEKEKEIILMNHLDRLLIVHILKDEPGDPAQRLENARKGAFNIHRLLAEHDIETVLIQNAGITAEEILSYVEGLALTNYQFLKYLKNADEKRHKLNAAGIVSESVGPEDIHHLNTLIKGVFYARDLVNEPLSYLSAKKLSEEFIRMGTEAGFQVEVFDKKRIESLKMGGLLAVNRGSVDPPTFSILTWKPENPVNTKPIVLVGKGVVYDTGGLSLKPTHDSMDYMKSDMAGAAAVSGVFYAVSANRLPVWIIGLIPATDNRPDGNAYVPGDVVTMYDGTTVEVLNTDAEGRMILADALSYARQYDPELVIELSTLTGAAQAAIDKYGIVAMGNAGREIMELLKLSGENTRERIAEFPFWEEYAEQLQSDIADLKNIGGKYAGAITAGKFLEHFTAYPYIHLDIAGPSYNKNPFNYRGKGASGIGVRLLFDFFYHRTH
ncbi:MAG: leucyl aminopeptidase [Bacteroidales bacterium]|nr:leucyl aminopeptidase [Bacteroidales bacterium]